MVNFALDLLLLHVATSSGYFQRYLNCHRVRSLSRADVGGTKGVVGEKRLKKVASVAYYSEIG